MIDNTLTFKFINGIVSYNTGEVFVVKLDPKISNTDELLKSLYYLLWFPGYFGFNWNALEDCLRNFEWISEHKIVIVHDVVPNIPDSDLKIYLEILRDTAFDWNDDECHKLEIVFQKRDQDLIEGILSL